jgi:hypothetical protein
VQHRTLVPQVETILGKLSGQHVRDQPSHVMCQLTASAARVQ